MGTRLIENANERLVTMYIPFKIFKNDVIVS